MEVPVVDNGHGDSRSGRSSACDAVWIRLRWWVRACAGLGSVMLFVVLAGVAAMQLSATPYRLTLNLPDGQSDGERAEFAAALEAELSKVGVDDARIGVLMPDEASQSPPIDFCSENALTAEFSLSRPRASELFSWVSGLGDVDAGYICGWQYTVDIGLSDVFSGSLGVGVPVVGVGLLVMLFYRARQGRLRVEGQLGSLRSAAGIGLIIGCLAFLALWMTEVVLRAMGWSPYSAVLLRESGPLGPIWTAVVIVVLTPVVEEYAFRLRFLEDAQKAVGAPTALVISSILFSLFHFPESLGALVFFLLAGLVLGALWIRTRSLLACWAAHSAHNALSFALSILG